MLEQSCSLQNRTVVVCEPQSSFISKPNHWWISSSIGDRRCISAACVSSNLLEGEVLKTLFIKGRNNHYS